MDYQDIKKFIAAMYGSQLVRFLIIGAVNTAFSYGIYSLFIFLGFHFTIATLFQILLSIAFNYITLGNLVFDRGDRGGVTLLRFILVCGIQYAVYTGGIWALSASGFNSYISGAIMILPVVVLSYILNKYFAFRKKETTEFQ